MNPFITMLAFTMCSTLCDANKDRDTIEKATNSSVRWDGTLLGVMPFVSDDLMNACRRNAKEPWFKEEMLRKLADEKTFVFAHVALTFVAEGKWDGTNRPGWFGLECELNAAGKIVVHEPKKQMKQLGELWARHFKPQPEKP